MCFLVACKNEEDPIKNEGAREVTTLIINFSDAQGELSPKSVMESSQDFKLIRAFMVGLVICKNEEDPSKNEGTRVVTTFLPLYKIFPIITLWELSVAMETRVLIRSRQKPNTVNPPPQ